MLAAHLLTLSRIPLALLFWIAVADAQWAIAVMAVAAVTDVVDGAAARRAQRLAEARGLRPAAGPGPWLDPLCDKVFVLSVIAATYVRLAPSPYLLATIAIRELILVPLAAIYRLAPFLRARMRYDFKAGPLGKAATMAQFLAIAAILLRHPSQAPLALVAGVVGLAAAIDYIRRGVRIARAQRQRDRSPY